MDERLIQNEERLNVLHQFIAAYVSCVDITFTAEQAKTFADYMNAFIEKMTSVVSKFVVDKKQLECWLEEKEITNMTKFLEQMLSYDGKNDFVITHENVYMLFLGLKNFILGAESIAKENVVMPEVVNLTFDYYGLGIVYDKFSELASG